METVSLKGKVIWFFGKSGSGKTTMADLLAEDLREKGLDVERLDGDIVRQSLCKDLGFTKEDIFNNIRRVCFVADILSRNGITVVASFITPSKANRLYLIEKLGIKLILIYLSASLKTCMIRDTKELYTRALEGEITNLAGFDSPFEEPYYILGFTVCVPTDASTIEDTYKALKGTLEWWDYEI